MANKYTSKDFPDFDETFEDNTNKKGKGNSGHPTNTPDFFMGQTSQGTPFSAFRVSKSDMEKYLKGFQGLSQNGNSYDPNELNDLVSSLGKMIQSLNSGSDDDDEDMDIDGLDDEYTSTSPGVRAIQTRDIDESSDFESLSLITLKQNCHLEYPFLVTQGSAISDWYQEFGEADEYGPDTFHLMTIRAIEEYEIIKIQPVIDNLESFKVVDYTDNYILFRVIPSNKEDQPFIIAVGKDFNEWFLYIPHFGNSIDCSENAIKSYNTQYNPSAFNPDGTLKKPYDLEKIKAECDLLFYPYQTRVTSVEDFGKVLQVQKQVMLGNNAIMVGDICSNNSFKAKQFIKDYGLEEGQRKFKFYIKLSAYRDFNTCNLLIEFLTHLDFNSNELIQNAELEPFRDGLAINLNLQRLEENLYRWSSEE